MNWGGLSSTHSFGDPGELGSRVLVGGDGTVFPCPVVSTSRPWGSRRLSKQTNWCEVEVVFNERTIRPENRLGAFGERETWDSFPCTGAFCLFTQDLRDNNTIS